jgi:hypothetical protein
MKAKISIAAILEMNTKAEEENKKKIVRKRMGQFLCASPSSYLTLILFFFLSSKWQGSGTHTKKLC